MSPTGGWTDADDRLAERFAEEAKIAAPDVSSAAAVLATAAFSLLAETIGIQPALHAFRSMADQASKRFAN